MRRLACLALLAAASCSRGGGSPSEPLTSNPLPPRAVELLEEEIRRLENQPADSLLDDEDDLRKLFNELRILDSLHPRRGDEIREPGRWTAIVKEARDLLKAEIGETGDGEEGDA